MFKTIDRYIIRKFLGTYVFAIILLLAIVVIFDINEKLDAFLKAPLHATIVDYFSISSLICQPVCAAIYLHRGNFLHIQAGYA